MTLQTVPGGMLFGKWPWINSGAFNTSELDLEAADDEITCITEIPRSGEITDVTFTIGNVTTAQWTIDVRLETVDETSGLSTGTLIDTNSNASQTVENTDDDTVFTTTLTAAATVTQGQKVAIVLKCTGDGGTSCGIKTISDDRNLVFPYLTDNNVAQVPAFKPCITLRYDDNSYYAIRGHWPLETVGAETFNSGDSPDVFANQFQVPFPTTCRGMWGIIQFDGNATVRLYDGTTVRCEANLDQATKTGSSDYSPWRLFWDDNVAVSYDLVANTVYRISVEATEGTDISIPYLDMGTGNNAILGAYPGGVNMYKSSDTSAVSSWTDDNKRLLMLGPMLDAFGDDAGGGGGMIVHPGMNGGIRG